MSADSESLLTRYQVARQIALEAGDLTLTHFRTSGLQVERKADDSPVTVADREAETLLRERIAEHFPEDGIVGEEYPERIGTTGYRWILDPIDGTKSFVSGVPLYGTLIGVTLDEEPQIGVINVPALNELVYAAIGQGAWCVSGGQPPVACKVSTQASLRDGIFLTTDIDSFSQRGGLPVFETLEKRSRMTRTWGDCYGYVLVATGRAEVMVDPALNVWDAAALLPILQESGGTFTDWRGNATIDGGDGVATNQLVLQEVLEITRQT